jgi:hypothetical protein
VDEAFQFEFSAADANGIKLFVWKASAETISRSSWLQSSHSFSFSYWDAGSRCIVRNILSECVHFRFWFTTTCGLSPSSVTPGASPATVTLTIKTTPTSAELTPLRPAQHQPVYAVWVQLQGLGLFSLMLAGSKRRRKKLFVFIAVVVLVGGMLFLSGCAGGTGIAQQNQSGTTPGAYTITVSGTSGALHHSVPLTLTVHCKPPRSTCSRCTSPC